MSSREVLVEIGPIKLYKGYPTRTNAQQHILPNNLLLSFINTKAESFDEIVRFCESYKIFISNKEEKISEAFKKEQELVLDFLQKLQNKTINRSDLKVVNQRLGSIKQRLDFRNIKEIPAVNRELKNYPVDEGEFEGFDSATEGTFLEIVKLTPGFSIVWDELVRIVLDNQLVRNCASCGEYILVKSSRPNKLYCGGGDCKNRATKKRSYQAKKISPSISLPR